MGRLIMVSVCPILIIEPEDDCARYQMVREFGPHYLQGFHVPDQLRDENRLFLELRGLVGDDTAVQGDVDPTLVPRYRCMIAVFEPPQVREV
jgi:hypothetical protein